MARKKSPKMGRPPRHAGERLSKNRTFRIRGELDAKLQEAASKTGRSVSEEIEYRLEQSFQKEDIAKIIRATLDSYIVRVPISEIGTRADREREGGVRLKKLLGRLPKEIDPDPSDVPPDK